MKQKIIGALTDAEKDTMVNAALQLLYSLESMGGDSTLAKTLRFFLSKMYKEEEEHYDVCHVDSVVGVRYDSLSFCQPYKKIANHKYYSDGRIMYGPYDIIFLDPWKPKDLKILKKIEEENEKFRQRYDIQNDDIKVAAQELAKHDIKEQDKAFKRELRKIKNMFLKYQINSYLGKSHKSSKKFRVYGKPAYTLVNIMKQTIKTEYEVNNVGLSTVPKSIEVLEPFVAKVFQNLKNLCGASSIMYHHIHIRYFVLTEDIAEAWKQRELWRSVNVRGFIRNEDIFKVTDIKVLTDPDIMKLGDIRLSYAVKEFLHLMYSLQSAADRHEMDPDLITFLTDLGILRPSQKKEEEVV